MTFDSTASSLLADENPETPLPRSSLAKAHVEPSCTLLKFQSLDRKPSPTTVGSVSLGDKSVVQGHLSKAENYLECNKVEAAIQELTAAAERVKVHTDLMHSSVDNAIARLTSLGCRATPPHPKAITLVRLRKTLPA